MSTQPYYLQLKSHGVYYFRIAIPKPLRLYFGKREFKKTLRTSNRKKAISRAMALSIEANELFERAYFMDIPDTSGMKYYLKNFGAGYPLMTI